MLPGDTISRPVRKPETGHIADRAINYGDEVHKNYEVR